MKYVELLTLALKDCGNLGIGQRPNAEDINDAMTTLMFMLDAWKLERLNIYHYIDMAFSPTGASSYSIGVGGDINIERPNSIESAFVRQGASSLGIGEFVIGISSIGGGPTPIDMRLEVLRSRDDWNLIGAKSVQSYPSVIYYDPAYPLGNILIWPIPIAGFYEIHLTLKGDWSTSVALADTISFPPGYLEAIRYNLAVRLAIMYDTPMRPEIVSAARASLAAVQRSNASIPELRPSSHLQRRMNRYNVFSGQ